MIMKSLREYITESEREYSQPVRGDNFAINIREECLLETYICDELEDGIVLHADDRMVDLLESYGFLEGDFAQLAQSVATAPVKPVASMEAHDHDYSDDDQDSEAGEYDYEGDMAKDDLETIVRAARRLTGMLDDNENMPEWVQSKINKAADYVDTAADYIESNKARAGKQGVTEGDMEEAKYQGREVPLGKPMRGDIKKSKVYVRKPNGNIVKVEFGQRGMKIKKNIPARRKNFRARHNCDNPGPRWKARYWSCRAW